MTSHAESVRDRLEHRRDVTSQVGYVVQSCLLVCQHRWAPPLDSTTSLAVLIQVRFDGAMTGACLIFFTFTANLLTLG